MPHETIDPEIQLRLEALDEIFGATHRGLKRGIAPARPVGAGPLSNVAIRRRYAGYHFDPRLGRNVRVDPRALRAQLLAEDRDYQTQRAELSAQQEAYPGRVAAISKATGVHENALRGVPTELLGTTAHGIAQQEERARLEQRELMERLDQRNRDRAIYENLIREAPHLANIIRSPEEFVQLGSQAALQLMNVVQTQQETQKQKAFDEETGRIIGQAAGMGPEAGRRLISQYAATRMAPENALAATERMWQGVEEQRATLEKAQQQQYEDELKQAESFAQDMRSWASRFSQSTIRPLASLSRIIPSGKGGSDFISGLRKEFAALKGEEQDRAFSAEIRTHVDKKHNEIREAIRQALFTVGPGSVGELSPLREPEVQAAVAYGLAGAAQRLQSEVKTQEDLAFHQRFAADVEGAVAGEGPPELTEPFLPQSRFDWLYVEAPDGGIDVAATIRNFMNVLPRDVAENPSSDYALDVIGEEVGRSLTDLLGIIVSQADLEVRAVRSRGAAR